MADLYPSMYYGEHDAEATDREWEEFAKLVEMKNKKREQQNTFYPSPSTEEEYESTIVSGLSFIKNNWFAVL